MRGGLIEHSGFSLLVVRMSVSENGWWMDEWMFILPVYRAKIESETFKAPERTNGLPLRQWRTE